MRETVEIKPSRSRARQRFEDGVSDFLDVLDAERRTLETQDERAESATRAGALLVAVYKALGGGHP
jgi:multidrug efflux system outer membrane protein